MAEMLLISSYSLLMNSPDLLSIPIEPFHWAAIAVAQGWSLRLPHQALDGDFSEDNRSKCRVATAPLIAAVENLTAFASNPEFVSVPAQIMLLNSGVAEDS